MPRILDRSLEEPILNKKESELARAAQRCIMAALDHSRADKIALFGGNESRITDDTPILELPPKVLKLMARALGAMADGKTILLVPQGRELSTVEAASLLNVSRPFLTKLLKEGKIPHSVIGSHRRVKYDDLIKYRDQMRDEQNKAMQALVDQSQELGLE
jgi:excisionase family DNA binding protein